MTETDTSPPETEADGPALDLLGDPVPDEDTGGYRVLARKYRPQTFDELIGQDALVRTLTNAIDTGRIAQGYMLTGVRGIGKTTTARIIAKALNCIGPDGTGGPTITPCGVCKHCEEITQDRHIDVLEMDAASQTGVGNVRENIIDGVQYAPASARYKVYIIDEVHMLSTQAFNALLKTLEEPPPHVKFIFATTEIGKVPVTVLSRCQRFDLRRVTAEMLGAHLTTVAEKEGAALEPAAISLIARAADGSVRDGLSLLDRVIAQADTDAAVSAEDVRSLLGLADRAQILDLFDLVMKGDAAAAVTLLDELYNAGAEAGSFVQDLLDITHWLTRLKVTPDTAMAAGFSDTEKDRAADMAAALSMPVLSRAWQMLLKGHGEVRATDGAITALEMLLIRLCYAADLPPPGDLVKALESGGDGAAAAGTSAAQAAGAGESAPTATAGAPLRAVAGGATAHASMPEPEPYPDYEPAPMAETAAVRPAPRSFEEAVALFADNREALLHAHLINDVRLVAFEPGRIEINQETGAPPNLANRVGALLTEWTGERWVVSVSTAAGGASLREQHDGRAAEIRAEAEANPVVRALLDTFPGAEITDIRERGAADSDFADTDIDDPAPAGEPEDGNSEDMDP